MRLADLPMITGSTYIGNNGEITLISSNEVHSESENSNFQMYRVDSE